MANAQQIEFLNSGMSTAYGLGWVYSYEAGTTSTNKTVYTVADKSANATNPFQLDANGRATVYADGNYKLVIKDVNLANAITLDNMYYSVLSTINRATTSVTADTTTTTSDYLVLVNTASGNVTVNLVTAAGNGGLEHLIIKTSADAYTVTVDPSGTQTIAGSSTKVLSAQYQAVGIISDNSNWQMSPNSSYVTLTDTQTLTNKTLTGPVMSVPQIQDTSSDHQYVIAVNELAADRTVTLPLLTTADEFVFKDHIQTLSNKTFTLPQINDTSSDHQYVLAVSELTSDRTVTLPLLTAGDQFVFRDHAQIALRSPQGFLLNGKISPTVASNNLTVAIKTMAGTDPSAADPVYVRIGDTVRSITAALSVTKNAATNWFNSGGAELATKEIDYFVYLGYNATDGVVVGFSRIPNVQQYDGFSVTTTDEKYCAISTITTAAAGDDYELIGRFAATLSAGAGYTWTVPTYTTVNLIQRSIYETRWLDFVPTIVGYSGTPTATAKYQVSHRIIKAYILITGTSNGTTLTFTGPFKALRAADFFGAGQDNTSDLATPAMIVAAAGSATLSAYSTPAAGVWTNSGTKIVYGTYFNFEF